MDTSPSDALARRPRSAQTRIILAVIIVLAIGSAVALNLRSMRWIPEADAKVAAARVRQAQAALDALRTKADSAPKDFAAQLEMAKALASKDQLLPASVYAEKAVALSPDSADAHLLLGMIYAPLDYSSRAETAYKRALVLNPSLLEVYQRHADLLRAQNRHSEAETLLRDSIKQAPDAPGPRISLAAIQAEKSKHHEVLDTLDPILKTETPPVAALYMAGKAWQASGQTKRAADSLRKAVAQEPEFADALHALGSILANEGKFAEGIPQLERAVQVVPRNPAYHYALANALRSDRSRPENIAAARKEFESAIELNPRDPFAHYYYGNILEEQSETLAATREYERTLEIEPTFSSARHRLGTLLKSLGKTAEGEKHLQRFANEARKSINEVHGGRRDNTFLDTAGAHYQRALGYLKTGKQDLARKSFQAALDRDPNHPEARRQLQNLGQP